MAQVIDDQCFLDGALLGLDKTAQQARGDDRVIGQLGIVDEVIAQTDGPAMLPVIGFAGELDKAAPAIACTVTGLAVADIRALIVKVEGFSAGRGIPL